MALVTSDEQDEAHLYYRIDDVNLRDGGKLLVRNPNSSALQNIQTNYLGAGGTGRLLLRRLRSRRQTGSATRHERLSQRAQQHQWFSCVRQWEMRAGHTLRWVEHTELRE